MQEQASEVREVVATHKRSIFEMISSMESQIERLITPQLAGRITKIYMVGCGDSYLAARGVRLFFDRHVGLPVESLESMEFSRYAIEAMPKGSLVIGISYGGKVSRTIEAVVRARKRGAHTIVTTGYGQRGAALQADTVIVGTLPGIRQVVDNLDAAVNAKKMSMDDVMKAISTPGGVDKVAAQMGIRGAMHLSLIGMGPILSSILALYLIGLRIGLLRKRLTPDDAARLRAEMLDAIDIQCVSVERTLQPARQLAEAFQNHDHFLFLGSGPSYATAYFCATKLFEQPNLNGIAQYIEEWAHLQLFYTRPGKAPVFVIVPPGESRDRAIEQIQGMKKLGATVIPVCDADDQELLALGDHAIPIYGRVAEEFTPLTYLVPGELFAFALLSLRGQPPIPAPYSFQKMLEVNYGLIYASAIRED